MYKAQDRRGRGKGVLYYHRAFLALEKPRNKFITALREFLACSGDHHSPYTKFSAYKQLLETLEEVKQLTGTTEYDEEINSVTKAKNDYEESVIEPVRKKSRKAYMARRGYIDMVSK